MNAFSTTDMMGALRLTRQGRLKEAVAVLRGRRASTPPPPQSDRSPGPDNSNTLGFVPEAFQGVLDNMAQFDPARLFKGPFGPAEQKAPLPQPDGSRFEERSFSHEAGTRKYKLFIPSSYRGEPLPLVVMLHGCTQSPDDFAAGTGMNNVAEEQGFLVAYPAQARSANVSKCWNWFNAADQRRGHGEPSLIAGITQRIVHDFAVRPGHIYIAGLSAGGAMAAILGSEYPELYAAIGVHSGLPRGAASDMTSGLVAMRQGGAIPVARTTNRSGKVVPTIVFHGDRDTTVNIVNGDHVIAQSKGAAHLQTTVIDSEAGGMRYTRTIQSVDGKRPVLEEWVLHGAGHTWSGGSAAGSFTEPRGPDASREMMRFFFQQPV